MPSRNVVRQYAPNTYFHVYNRGVEKRIIFYDEQDYKIFLYYLFIYLAPPQVILERYEKLKVNLLRNNLHTKIELLVYCLMPNHFHFLLHQIETDGVTRFMRQITNAYTTYFNTKYDRVGSLMQGPFKAGLVDTNAYLLELSRYIHKNPLSLPFTQPIPLEEYKWSSYRIYLRKQSTLYVKPDMIIDFFSKENENLGYKSFVEEHKEELLPENLLIDN